MRLSLIFSITSFLTSNLAIAGGNGGHGSVSDLIAPAFNVFVLVSFLVWKLRKPLKESFEKKSDEISNTLERASLKSKEAQMMYENEVRKLNNLNNEIKVIQQQAESDLTLFEKNFVKEVEEKTRKLKNDANQKIVADKKQLVSELNNQLLDQVIAKAKQTIQANKNFQEKTSNKLLKGLH
jgi:F0F1-type ATP synthase membrane subunit b/b'